MDPDAQHLTVRATSGTDGGVGVRVGGDDASVAAPVAAGRPVVVHDPTDAEMGPLLFGRGVRTLLAAPLRVGPRTVGVLQTDWLAPRHRLLFALHRLRGVRRASDVRLAIFGPAALTALASRAGQLRHALPRKTFYAVHAEPKLFFEPRDISVLIEDPDIIGFHISPKGRGDSRPAPGSLHAWAAERFGA